jgi:UDP-2,3-diacylglucosamine pyrophosphatase LpxH
MNDEISEAASLLLNCEEKGLAPAYIINPLTYKEKRTSFFKQAAPERTEPVHYTSEKEEIFIVSDLHIASGRNKSGVYRGTENFFADESFARFLDYANRTKKTVSAILIINGDIFDFLRITDYPGKVRQVRPVKKLKKMLKFEPVTKYQKPSDKDVRDEYDEWLTELAKVGITKSRQEIENCISDRERTYGLSTDDYKTIYRLIKIRQGHPEFCKALSLWIENGNKLIVVKGNHDVEICFPAVRNYLRLIIAEGFSDSSKSTSVILKDIVLPNITFIDDSIVIDKYLLAEHGHRYDKFSFVLDSPLLKGGKQVNIPFGSFINRYLLNQAELFLPFLDNVRPAANILPMLIRENFPLAIKVLFQHIPLTLRILTTSGRYMWYMFNRIFWFFIALVVPLVLVVVLNWQFITHTGEEVSKLRETSGFISALLSEAASLLMLVLSYFFSRFVAWLQVTEPSSLNTYAEELANHTDYKIITMGHTHNPGEYIFGGKCRFYNTGTWVPVIEISNAEVRGDKVYTFLHLTRDMNGNIQPPYGGLLQRWNDDAGRAEPLVLIEKK